MIKTFPNILRRSLLCLAGAVMFQNATAQFRYTVKDTTTAYAALPAGATSLNGSTIWDGDQFTAAIPFSWKLDSTITMNSVPVDLSFPGIVESFTGTSGQSGFFFASTWFIDRGDGGPSSRSPITYTTVGTSPNRIFKLQFANAGFGDDPTLSDYVNFQVWIYETTNVVEYHFGASSVSATEDYFGTGAGPVLGGFRNMDIHNFTSGTLYYVDESKSPIRIDSFAVPSTGIPTNALSAWPASGRVLRFTPRGSSCAKPAATFTATPQSTLTARFTFTAATTGLDSLVWNFGDGQKHKTTTGFTTPVTHTYTTAGRYSASVTAYNRCGFTTAAASQVKVAVADVPELGKVRVYPTTVDDRFSVEGLSAGTRVRVLNAGGQLLREITATGSSVSIQAADLPAGVYTVQCTDGSSHSTARIIKR